MRERISVLLGKNNFLFFLFQTKKNKGICIQYAEERKKKINLNYLIFSLLYAVYVFVFYCII